MDQVGLFFMTSTGPSTFRRLIFQPRSWVIYLDWCWCKSKAMY